MPATRSKSPRKRVIAVLRHVALIVAAVPALARAITLAMSNADPDVDHLRVENGNFVLDLIAEAAGAPVDDETVVLLNLIYTGAMVRAGLGGLSYLEVANYLEDASNRLLS